MPAFLCVIAFMLSGLIAVEASEETQKDSRSKVSTKLGRPTRLSRPVNPIGELKEAEDNFACESSNHPGCEQKLVSIDPSTGKFRGILPGLSSRWWRNFRNPSFCPFIICGGTCANIMGVPIVGAYTSTQLMSDETPCSIESVESSGGCCMHQTSQKSDADCCSSK